VQAHRHPQARGRDLAHESRPIPREVGFDHRAPTDTGTAGRWCSSSDARRCRRQKADLDRRRQPRRSTARGNEVKVARPVERARSDHQAQNHDEVVAVPHARLRTASSDGRAAGVSCRCPAGAARGRNQIGLVASVAGRARRAVWAVDGASSLGPRGCGAPQPLLSIPPSLPHRLASVARDPARAARAPPRSCSFSGCWPRSRAPAGSATLSAYSIGRWRSSPLGGPTIVPRLVALAHRVALCGRAPARETGGRLRRTAGLRGGGLPRAAQRAAVVSRMTRRCNS
jgi:hypothetical protein